MTEKFLSATINPKQTKNSRTTENIFTKFHKRNPWAKGIQVYSNEGPIPFSKENIKEL